LIPLVLLLLLDPSPMRMMRSEKLHTHIEQANAKSTNPAQLLVGFGSK